MTDPSNESPPKPSDPPRKRGRRSYEELAAAEGMTVEEWKEKRRMLREVEAENQTTQKSQPQTTSDGRRNFPEDVSEQEKILKRFRPYGNLIVNAVDKTTEFAKVKRLDEIEKSNGADAFAQLLYEEGANLSARVLVLLWLITTALPRLVEWLDKKAKEKEKSRNPLAVIEKVVEGERTK
jgi:hypothetical protein